MYSIPHAECRARRAYVHNMHSGALECIHRTDIYGASFVGDFIKPGALP